jgi:hypothetical protein
VGRHEVVDYYSSCWLSDFGSLHFFLLLHGMRSDAVRKIEERTQSVTAGRTIRKEAFMGKWMADEGIDSRHLPHYDQGVTHPY